MYYSENLIVTKTLLTNCQYNGENGKEPHNEMKGESDGGLPLAATHLVTSIIEIVPLFPHSVYMWGEQCE